MASKTDVWMPLYIADYLADTNRLTTLQHGAYMLLIMDYWRNGVLPDDDSILAQITKMTPDAWSITRASLVKFFSIINGNWVHGRIDAEIEKASVNSQKAHDRAVKAAAARWDKENASSNASGNAPSIVQGLPEIVLEECPSPSPSPSPTESTTTTADKSKDLPAPPVQADSKKGTRLPSDWALPKAWGEWALSEKPQWTKADVRRVADDFKDHWLSNANQAKSKKADWLATWRKWVRSPLNEIKQSRGGVASQSENDQIREAARKRIFGEQTIESV
jgi:uncharacterized protein YdaU (DUF1376 family)